MGNRKQKGFGITEYMIGIIVLVGVFFTPYVNNKSIVTILIEAIKKEHSGYIYAQSLSQFQVTKVSLKNKQQKTINNK